MTPTCNICGSSEWGDMGSRKGVRCIACNSLERTRVIKMFLDRDWRPGRRPRVLHFSPEKGLYDHLAAMDLEEYRIVDFAPQNFKFAELEQFDLCKDGPSLPSDTYDLIIHSHVMEHIPCNVTAILSHIHRSLRQDGLHLMCVPFMTGESEEDFSELTQEDAKRRFGQRDHVRKFGKNDFDRNLGMIFRTKSPYGLQNYFTEEELRASNIPEREWQGYTGTSVFPLVKSDYLL